MKKMKFAGLWGVAYIKPKRTYTPPAFTGYTRSAAIEAFNKFWAGDPNRYRKLRRKGKCIAVKLYVED